MAHFAQIDSDNIVTQVIVINNDDILDSSNNESEAIGITVCKSIHGASTNWVQTSYNGNFRKNYAGIGFEYDSTRDAFIPPKLFDSWVLNETTCRWDPPVAYPTDGALYEWDEATTSWQTI